MMTLHNVASLTEGSAYLGFMFFRSVLYYKCAHLTVLLFIINTRPECKTKGKRASLWSAVRALAYFSIFCVQCYSKIQEVY